MLIIIMERFLVAWHNSQLKAKPSKRIKWKTQQSFVISGHLCHGRAHFCIFWHKNRFDSTWKNNILPSTNYNIVDNWQRTQWRCDCCRFGRLWVFRFHCVHHVNLRFAFSEIRCVFCLLRVFACLTFFCEALWHQTCQLVCRHSPVWTLKTVVMKTSFNLTTKINCFAHTTLLCCAYPLPTDPLFDDWNFDFR